MSELQYILFAIASALTFASYHIIPALLERLAARGGETAFHGVVRSSVFTQFVRFCGTDHAIMAGCMGAMTFGHWHPVLGWVIVGSSWLVAVISMVSAAAIWSEKQQ